MVNKTTTSWIVVRATIYLGLIVLIWKLAVPIVIDGHGENAIGNLLQAAINRCMVDETYPPSLCDIEPCLERILHHPCRVERIRDDQYRVELRLRDKTDILLIDYISKEDGSLEKYHVIDHVTNH